LISALPYEVAALRSLLVVGFAATSQAVAAACLKRGIAVTAIDDNPTSERSQSAQSLGVELLPTPTGADLDVLVASFDGVAPSPGVPLSHPIFASAERTQRPIVCELDLAYSWTDAALVAVTGTNGKTTVTTLVTDMLVASGIHASAAGNTDVPLVSAIDDGADTYVVEASSFRLRPCQYFRPGAAAWLNLASDHLDWHGGFDDYRASKAQIATQMQSTDLLVLPDGDQEILKAVGESNGTKETFGAAGGDYRWVGTKLVGPGDYELSFPDGIPRSHPHDLANAAAAVALARRAGADSAAIGGVLTEFRGVEHRLWLAGTVDGVRYFDDSKATAPHATRAALRGFDSVVLIAGGRNKGLDLSEILLDADSVHSVVAIGESAQDIAEVFADRPVRFASDMSEAVFVAAELAKAGDSVLLSPACASFDWYDNYEARGRDFCRVVELMSSAGRQA
jgi:UDP-N-acetylmuramoylalanine--D-glutamate ligase